MVGFSATDTIQLYDVSRSLIVPFTSANFGIQYRLISTYVISPESMACYIQFHTADWYGVWVNECDATTNPTGCPTTGDTAISGL